MGKLFASLIVALLLAAGVAPGVFAQSRGDQDSARKEIQEGRSMPPREIERRILPQMKGNEYLGFEYDGTASAYRLKFIREGQVIWVDVDARTARIMRISR
jgi:uncharacterized membrane protein YkoI